MKRAFVGLFTAFVVVPYPFNIQCFTNVAESYFADKQKYKSIRLPSCPSVMWWKKSPVFTLVWAVS
jgi:hypothetical protein